MRNIKERAVLLRKVTCVGVVILAAVCSLPALAQGCLCGIGELMAPLAVPESLVFGIEGSLPPAHFGDQLALRVNDLVDVDGVIYPGEVYTVAYNQDRGASDYEERLAHGLTLCDWEWGLWIYSEPGMKAGPTIKGLAERLAADTWLLHPQFDDWAWQIWLADPDPQTGLYRYTRRIICVPVMREGWAGRKANGRYELPVSGFGFLFVETFYQEKGETVIVCRLVQPMMSDGFFFPIFEIPCWS